MFIVAGHQLEPKFGGRFLQLGIHINTSEQRRPLVIRTMRAACGPQKNATLFSDSLSTREEWLTASALRPCHPNFFLFAIWINTDAHLDVIAGRVRRALRSKLVEMDTRIIEGPEAPDKWMELVFRSVTSTGAHPWPRHDIF